MNTVDKESFERKHGQRHDWKDATWAAFAVIFEQLTYRQAVEQFGVDKQDIIKKVIASQ